jgi:TRAP-type C4-dicarboxylate transport system permease small subunit
VRGLLGRTLPLTRFLAALETTLSHKGRGIDNGLESMNIHPPSTTPPPDADARLIVAEDEEVIIEHHPEDWLAFALFWTLAGIVFLQFFTRYIMNDSLSWTEEIARYGLMWLAFIGGAVVTRKKAHIAVELLSNLMKPSPLRSALLALVDFITLGFMGLLAYFSVTIIERMHAQTMTVVELPMSIVYGGVGLGCFLMLARQIQVVWRNARDGWRRPHEIVEQIHAD